MKEIGIMLQDPWNLDFVNWNLAILPIHSQKDLSEYSPHSKNPKDSPRC
jgi:hypothetical protein